MKNKEYNKLLCQERLILNVTETIVIHMKDKEISRKQLADKLDKNKSFITQILSGDRNITLRTLSDIMFALEIEFIILNNKFN